MTTQPGFALIIHPELGPASVSEVPETSLGQWYRCGWRPLASDDLPPPAAAEEPQPMTRAAAKAAAAKSDKE